MSRRAHRSTAFVPWWGRPPRRLTGASALVTGASSGVGRAIALELVHRGAHVLATARRGERLARLADEASVGPGSLVLLAGDMTRPDFRGALVARAEVVFGNLELLVAAAGGGAIGRFADADPDTLARIVDLDFLAQAELVRSCLPLLRKGRDPAVVLIGSILGYHPLPMHAEYSAAKAALRSLAVGLRMELDPAGIGVLLASLGPTESEFWSSLIAGNRPSWSRGIPLTARRTAERVVHAVVRRREEVVPGWRAKAYVAAARLFPGLCEKVMMRLCRTEAESADAQAVDRP